MSGYAPDGLAKAWALFIKHLGGGHYQDPNLYQGLLVEYSGSASFDCYRQEDGVQMSHAQQTWSSDRFMFGSSLHGIYCHAHGWPNPAPRPGNSDSQQSTSRQLLYHDEYYHGSGSQRQDAPDFFANPYHKGVFCIDFTPGIFWGHPTIKCQEYQALLKCAEGSDSAQSFDIDLSHDWSESGDGERWVFHTGGTAKVTIISHVCTKTSDSSRYGEEDC